MIKNKDIRIMEAALTCFVEQGFYATQTAQIAERAGLSVGTLFRCYPTKDMLGEAVTLYIQTLLTSHLQSPEAATRPGEPLQSWVARQWVMAAQVALAQPLAFAYWNRQRVTLCAGMDKDGFIALGPFVTVLATIQRQLNIQHISPRGESLPLPRPLPLLTTLLVTQWAAAVESVLSFSASQTDTVLEASILNHVFESFWAGIQLPTYLVAESMLLQKVELQHKPSSAIKLHKPSSLPALTPGEKFIVSVVEILVKASFPAIYAHVPKKPIASYKLNDLIGIK